MFRLRADVALSLNEKTPVYAIAAGAHASDLAGYHDPRHRDMGFRAFEKPHYLEETPFSHWDRLRISLCIPDGSRDLVIGQSALSEGRIDTLNGVCYDKGCYIGQELTARMHYRGLAKKHLYIVCAQDLGLDRLPDYNEPILFRDKKVGIMRSKTFDSLKNCEIGLALLKDIEAENIL